MDTSTTEVQISTSSSKLALAPPTRLTQNQLLSIRYDYLMTSPFQTILVTKSLHLTI